MKNENNAKSNIIGVFIYRNVIYDHNVCHSVIWALRPVI